MAPAVAEECLVELRMAVMATGILVEEAFHLTTQLLSERIKSRVKVR
jgi:hypothetical protein